MFVVAVLAAIIASQAMISGTFSIIHQSLALGCFPRVKVVHTSSTYEGQVYIPELNFLLMFGCIIVTFGFGTSSNIGNAYGIAVVFAETITSLFMVLVMLLIWKKHIIVVLLYVCCIMLVELVYLSSALSKFTHGGYFPIAFALVLMTIMFIWNYTYRKTYYYELENKVSTNKLREILDQSDLCRVPGLAIFYSELVHGIPPIFDYYVGNVNALHSVVVFTSIKSLHVSKVPPEERFLFRRVDPKMFMFRCVVRYGYTDKHDEKKGFEKLLVERLLEFIRKDTKANKKTNTMEHYLESKEDEIHNDEDNEEEEKTGIKTDVEMVETATKIGVVHMMGESEVIAKKESNIVKRVVINYGYGFLKRNVRRNDEVFDVPRARLLKVGMTYEL
ncbi:Potassium transporter 5 [Bienertia sinuspersici]